MWDHHGRGDHHRNGRNWDRLQGRVEFDGCTGMTLDAAAQCFMQVTAWTESTPAGHTGSLTLVDMTDPVDDAGVELTITSASDAGCF